MLTSCINYELVEWVVRRCLPGKDPQARLAGWLFLALRTSPLQGIASVLYFRQWLYLFMTNKCHFSPSPSGWAHILGEETNFRWGQTGLNLQSSENQFTLTVHDASSKLRFPLRPGILWSLRPVSETPLPPSDTVTQGSQRRKGKRTQSDPPREGLNQPRGATSKEWPPGSHKLENTQRFREQAPGGTTTTP